MFEDPKSFSAEVVRSEWPGRQTAPINPAGTRTIVTVLQLSAGFVLIEAALWTPIGTRGVLWIGLASLCIIFSILSGDYSLKSMGLAIPRRTPAAWTLLGGTILSAAIPLLSRALGYHSGPVHRLSFLQACGYAIWALLQQFILQAFFYLRLESLFGGRRAVLASAFLFAVVHIPNPVLTVGSLLGGLFFCEMFRRYRNIFPLGLAHATLGLTIAASFSDAVLRHMLVGEAYLSFHP